jgi:hypothetical protein
MLLILSQSSEQPRLFDSEFRLLGNTGRSGIYQQMSSFLTVLLLMLIQVIILIP